MERRLSAILAADMVGYSRLMEADETGTIERQKAHRRELIDPTIEEHHGRIVKTTGDGMLCEFASVVDAVQCSVAIQRAMAEREAGVDESSVIHYRIGINLGDVAVDDGDLYGDGVNVAARLEQLADPGGICISGTAYDQMQSTVGIGYRSLGEVQVKNIARPIRAYAVLLDGENTGKAVASTRSPRLKQIAAVAAVALLALAGGGLWWMQTDGARQPDAANLQSDGSRTTPTKPEQELAVISLIVLPFDDLSPDKSLDHFVFGLTEELTAEISKWGSFRVIARNTAMTYQDKAVDIRKVAEETHVQYVIEGSVRKSGDRLRITAQLIDGTTGNHVWADNFDETNADVLALQDRITSKIVTTLSGDNGIVRRFESEQAWAKGEVELGEYDYYLRGHLEAFKYTPQGSAQAKAIWEEGLAKFPNSGLLKVKLSFAYFLCAVFGVEKDVKSAFARAEELLAEGLADESLPAVGHRVAMQLRAAYDIFIHGNYEVAVRNAKIAVKAYPYDAETLAIMANQMSWAGENALADEWYTKWLESELHPSSWRSYSLGRFRYQQGRYADAVEILENNPRTLALPFLAASYVELGEMAKARLMATEISDKIAWLTPDAFYLFFPYKDKSIIDTLLARLAKAGWPKDQTAGNVVKE